MKLSIGRSSQDTTPPTPRHSRRGLLRGLMAGLVAYGSSFFSAKSAHAYCVGCDYSGGSCGNPSGLCAILVGYCLSAKKGEMWVYNIYTTPGPGAGGCCTYQAIDLACVRCQPMLMCV